MPIRSVGFYIVFLAASLGAAAVEQIAGGGQAAPGASAKEIQFIEPFGVAFDSARNLYVIEYKGNRLIRIDRDGKTALLAGAETFNEPHGIVINRNDHLFIADTHNDRVLRMDLASGELTTVAGNGQKGYAGDGGRAVDAAFHGIYAIDLAPNDRDLYIVDLTNRRIRRVDLESGIVTTAAGNGQQGVPPDTARAIGAPLVNPRAVVGDAEGNVYILERTGNALRRVDADGLISTLIKPGDISPDLNGPKHLCLDRNGDIIIADAENHLIRRYSLETGETTTIMGTGEKGDRIDAADPLKTQLNRPHGVYVDSDGTLYVSDSYNHRLLKVTGL